jgi:hypothetical protein
MKKSIYLLALISSFSSYACLRTDSMSICPGDFATVGDHYSRGAKVVSVNVRTQMVGLRSISNGEISSFPAREVLIGKGCVENVCVGDFATVSDLYSRGAKVISVNRVTKQIGLQSINNGAIYAHPARDVLVGKECLDYSSSDRALESYFPSPK